MSNARQTATAQEASRKPRIAAIADFGRDKAVARTILTMKFDFIITGWAGSETAIL